VESFIKELKRTNKIDWWGWSKAFLGALPLPFPGVNKALPRSTLGASLLLHNTSSLENFLKTLHVVLVTSLRFCLNLGVRP